MQIDVSSAAFILLSQLVAAQSLPSSMVEQQNNGWCMLQSPRQKLSMSRVHEIHEESGMLQIQFEQQIFADAQAHQLYWTEHKDVQSHLVSHLDDLFRGIDKNLQDAVDRFQKANRNASGECATLLKEAKQLLTGLHKRTREVQHEMKIKEEALEAQQVLLDGEKLKQKVLRDEKKVEDEKCLEEMQEADKMYRRYNAELHELEQIASPNITWNSSRAKLSLATLGMHVDGAGAAFLLCVTHSSQSPGAEVQETCDRQRQELQRNLTSAYKKIRALVTAFNKTRNDEACLDDVKKEYEAKQTSIALAVGKAGQSLKEEMAASKMLASELQRLQSQETEFQENMKKISDACKGSIEVKEYVDNVHELIKDMRNCPGVGRSNLTISENDTKVITTTKAPTTTTKAPTTTTKAPNKGLADAIHEELKDGFTDPTAHKIQKELHPPNATSTTTTTSTTAAENTASTTSATTTTTTTTTTESTTTSTATTTTSATTRESTSTTTNTTITISTTSATESTTMTTTSSTSGTSPATNATAEKFVFRLSEKYKNCEDLGDSWATASVSQVKKWCGCPMIEEGKPPWLAPSNKVLTGIEKVRDRLARKRKERKECLCKDKLEDLKWKTSRSILGLKDGRVYGKIWKYNARWTGRDETRMSYDLCVRV